MPRPPSSSSARRAGGGGYHVLSYADLAANPSRVGRDFDVIVANFALLDDRVAPLLAALGGIFAHGGALVIQTLHPLVAGEVYRDGWRVEHFQVFGKAGPWQPMPWYFRTLGSWLMLLGQAGYNLLSLDEPLHPETALPLLSLLLTATPTSPSATPPG